MNDPSEILAVIPETPGVISVDVEENEAGFRLRLQPAGGRPVYIELPEVNYYILAQRMIMAIKSRDARLATKAKAERMQ